MIKSLDPYTEYFNPIQNLYKRLFLTVISENIKKLKREIIRNYLQKKTARSCFISLKIFTLQISENSKKLGSEESNLNI